MKKEHNKSTDYKCIMFFEIEKAWLDDLIPKNQT